MRYSMRHFRQTHASYQCAKRKQKRTSVDIAIDLPFTCASSRVAATTVHFPYVPICARGR